VFKKFLELCSTSASALIGLDPKWQHLLSNVKQATLRYYCRLRDVFINAIINYREIYIPWLQVRERERRLFNNYDIRISGSRTDEIASSLNLSPICVSEKKRFIYYFFRAANTCINFICHPNRGR